MVIVGSGLGGPSAACLLARAGKRVCVLEQHDRAGGCSHVFKEHGWEWDVGLHYVGRIGNPIHKNRILSDMMTDGKLDWNRLDRNYDTTVIAGEKIKFYGNLDETKESLYKHFPKEKKAIDRYFELAMQCLKETDDAFDHVAKPSLPLLLRILLPIKRMFESNRSEYWMNRTSLFNSFFLYKSPLDLQKIYNRYNTECTGRGDIEQKASSCIGVQLG